MKRAIVSACIAASLWLPATGVGAAKPEFERLSINESSVDPFLSEVCGFEVVTTTVGHVTIRTSPDRTVGAVRIASVNVLNTASANGNEFSFRDVGADVARIAPNGDLLLSVIGQLPFGFTGVFKINLTTGDVVLEPHHSTEGDLDAACAALAA